MKSRLIYQINHNDSFTEVINITVSSFEEAKEIILDIMMNHILERAKYEEYDNNKITKRINFCL